MEMTFSSPERQRVIVLYIEVSANMARIPIEIDRCLFTSTGLTVKKLQKMTVSIVYVVQVSVSVENDCGNRY